MRQLTPEVLAAFYQATQTTTDEFDDDLAGLLGDEPVSLYADTTKPSLDFSPICDLTQLNQAQTKAPTNDTLVWRTYIGGDYALYNYTLTQFGSSIDWIQFASLTGQYHILDNLPYYPNIPEQALEFNLKYFDCPIAQLLVGKDYALKGQTQHALLSTEAGLNKVMRFTDYYAHQGGFTRKVVTDAVAHGLQTHCDQHNWMRAVTLANLYMTFTGARPAALDNEYYRRLALIPQLQDDPQLITLRLNEHWLKAPSLTVLQQLPVHVFSLAGIHRLLNQLSADDIASPKRQTELLELVTQSPDYTQILNTFKQGKLQDINHRCSLIQNYLDALIDESQYTRAEDPVNYNTLQLIHGICAITQEPFIEASCTQITVETLNNQLAITQEGFIYEKSAIEDWKKRSDSDPHTRNKIIFTPFKYDSSSKDSCNINLPLLKLILATRALLNTPERIAQLPHRCFESDEGLKAGILQVPSVQSIASTGFTLMAAPLLVQPSAPPLEEKSSSESKSRLMPTPSAPPLN